MQDKLIMKKNVASASSGSAINSNKDAEGGGSSHKVDGGSVFHAKLRTNACETSMNETMGSMKNYVDALVQFCCAGHQTADQLAKLLSPTIYSEISRQFVDVTKEVETAVKMEGAQVKADAEMFWSQLGRSYEGENNNKTSTVSQDVEVRIYDRSYIFNNNCHNSTNSNTCIPKVKLFLFH